MDTRARRVSSDGEHGFTIGYLTVTRPDGSVLPAKYVAYWVRGDAGWRVAAYKRVPRALATYRFRCSPLAAKRALPRGDATAVQRYADELSLAEHAFSRDAAPMGLGPAFEKWGAPDAVNTGGQNAAEFVSDSGDREVGERGNDARRHDQLGTGPGDRVFNG